jgi:hypothetical protein
MDEDFSLTPITEGGLKRQKSKLKGKVRHDKEETRKLQVMKLGVKYDVEVDDNTQLSTRVYNDICGHQRKGQRDQRCRGKYTRKQKRNEVTES